MAARAGKRYNEKPDLRAGIWIQPSPADIIQLKRETAGHIGKSAEISLGLNAGDKFVEIYSSRGSVIRQILERVGSKVKAFIRIHEDGVPTQWTLQIESDVFRGFDAAFKRYDNPTTTPFGGYTKKSESEPED